MAISVAGGLLLVGYSADALLHWYSRIPSDQFARDDSLFRQLAGRLDGVTPASDSTGRSHADSTVEAAATGRDSLVKKGTTAGVTGPKLIDLNAASRTELIRLPGIGPALADRIVRSRESLGPFRDLNDLQRVPGIGPAKVRKISALVTTGATARPP